MRLCMFMWQHFAFVLKALWVMAHVYWSFIKATALIRAILAFVRN